jgi:hypothetical protein
MMMHCDRCELPSSACTKECMERNYRRIVIRNIKYFQIHLLPSANSQNELKGGNRDGEGRVLSKFGQSISNPR